MNYQTLSGFLRILLTLKWKLWLWQWKFWNYKWNWSDTKWCTVTVCCCVLFPYSHLGPGPDSGAGTLHAVDLLSLRKHSVVQRFLCLTHIVPHQQTVSPFVCVGTGSLWSCFMCVNASFIFNNVWNQKTASCLFNCGNDSFRLCAVSSPCFSSLSTCWTLLLPFFVSGQTTETQWAKQKQLYRADAARCRGVALPPSPSLRRQISNFLHLHRLFLGVFTAAPSPAPPSSCSVRDRGPLQEAAPAFVAQNPVWSCFCPSQRSNSSAFRSRCSSVRGRLCSEANIKVNKLKIKNNTAAGILPSCSSAHSDVLYISIYDACYPVYIYLTFVVKVQVKLYNIKRYLRC